MFYTQKQINESSWQSFERNVCRLLSYEGYENVRLVGQTNDHGADVIANRAGKRWLFQVKHWKKPVGLNVITEVQNGLLAYNAQIPVIVASNGFETSVKEHQQKMMVRQIPLQLIDANMLIARAARLPNITTNKRNPRPYQEDAIKEIVGAFYAPNTNKALVVMATGLGKTFVAAESIRRIRENKKVKVLVCAHTNDLVYQLERAFWPFIKPSDTTLVWNSY